VGKAKDPKELAALKEEWLASPYWVLENTEGFDEHRAELRQFRLDAHARQEREHAEQIFRSTKVGDAKDFYPPDRLEPLMLSNSGGN
jgi:hypothetical protein